MEKDLQDCIEEYENRKKQIDVQREEMEALKAKYEKQIKPLEDQIEDLRISLEKDLEPIKRKIKNQETELDDFAQRNSVFIKFGDIVQVISEISGIPIQDINIYGEYSYSFSPLDIYGKDKVTKEDFLQFDNNYPLYPIYLHLSVVEKNLYNQNCTSFEFTHTFRCHLSDVQSDGKTLLEHSDIKPKTIEYNGSRHQYTSLVLDESQIECILCPFTLKQLIELKNDLLKYVETNGLDSTNSKQKTLTRETPKN